MRTYLIPAITITLQLSSCIAKETAPVPLDTRLVDRPIVPKNIAWHSDDNSRDIHVDQYAKFRTYYFNRDSTFFAFDCINDKRVVCRDTSIYDTKSKVYNDTAICFYEDSILFGVENVEMHKGTYQSSQSQIVCNMDGSYDTLSIIERSKEITLLSKGQPYVPASNFKKESYRRLGALRKSQKNSE